jgi:PAS domain S-box-containing protein
MLRARRIVEPHFQPLVADFYTEINKHPAASRVIDGGQSQIDRLRQTLMNWLGELFSGNYDEEYVAKRWRAGLKHVEIGLPQVYATAALSRLRIGMIRVLRSGWRGDDLELTLTLQSLNKLLDLDLAVIGDAYETEYVERQQAMERGRLRDVLHQEQELSAGLLAHAQAAVLILDRHGKIVRPNTFTEQLAELTAAELQDRDWFELFLPEADRARLRQELRDAPPRCEPVTATAIFTGPTRTRHLHWSAVPLCDAAGEPFALLVIGHDITTLHESQQRALQAQRLATIGQMATGLAHESRNALQRIGASAEMLELELEGSPAALALVARIQQSQAQLHKLLDEVRNYAAPIALDRSPCRLSEVWREAWELLLSQRRGRQAELREQLATHDLTIDIDRFRLVQVFRNLLENALAACDDPALIEIECAAATVNGAPGFRVWVRDNGPGLTADQVRRAFEPFFTTKPTGTGLGLAIAQRIVESHGGTIGIGRPPQGAEFILELPAKAD